MTTTTTNTTEIIITTVKMMRAWPPDSAAHCSLLIMKILYLSPCGQMGGAEKSLLDVLASLRAARPHWSLRLIVAENGPLVSQSLALGVPTTIVPFPSALSRIGDAAAGGPAGHRQSRLFLVGELSLAAPAVLAYVENLRRVLVELAPDIVHSNGFKMHLLGMWAKPRGVPIVWHIHDYVSARPLMARLLRRYARRCALAVANSRNVAADVEQVCGNRVAVKTIYNAVDLKDFSPVGSRLNLDELSGLPPASAETIKVGMLA